MEFSITGEYDGIQGEIAGVRLKSILDLMLEDSNDEQDFIDKLTYFVTDHTSSLSHEDVLKLKNWYKENAKGQVK